MPSRTPKKALNDIKRCIGLAVLFCEHVDLAAFTQDTMRFFAVVRALEIISEASRRLPSDMKSRMTGIPWDKIAGAGNVFRHAYEDVDPVLVWNVVKFELDALLSVVERELAQG